MGTGINYKRGWQTIGRMRGHQQVEKRGYKPLRNQIVPPLLGIY